MTGLWLLVITAVLGCPFVFLSLERAPLLRFIAGDPENAGKVPVNFGLVQRVFVWVLLPIVVVLAAQYRAWPASSASYSSPSRSRCGDLEVDSP